MSQTTFEIVSLIVKVIVLIVLTKLAPKINSYLGEVLTEKQIENAKFWVEYATRIAEDLYKQRFQGKSKKQFVIDWLKDKNINVTESQLNSLIDLVVDEYNRNGWDKKEIQPKILTKEEFDKLYVKHNIAVHCSTEEKANKFLALAEKFGYTWASGYRLTDSNEWEKYKENTCYILKRGLYRDYTEVKAENGIIVEFE